MSVKLHKYDTLLPENVDNLDKERCGYANVLSK